MNILHISSTDLRGAGSAVVALNALLNDRGHNSKLVVVFKTKKDPNIIGFIKPINKRIKALLDFAILRFHKLQTFVKVGRTHPDYFFYNLDERKSNFSAEAILKKINFIPDVIFIHWVSNFINTATINKLHQITGAKMFWVMIDNAPITGGCHYPWDCKGYETDCSNCPALLSPKKKYIARRNFALKKNNMPQELQILTFSTTDKLRAEKCSFYTNRKAKVVYLPVNEQITPPHPHKLLKINELRYNYIHIIFHPINENMFYPQSQTDARQYFDLPQDKKIIFFAATDLSERRKGFAELQEALKIFEQKILDKGEEPQDYLLITAGKQFSVKQSSYSIPARYLGYLTEQEMVKAFNAATLFVCPTLEDSGPGILGQAMLCGTPTVAFATGAAVDMLRDNRSGYLAQLGNSADLARGIDFITHLSAEQYAAMSTECRTVGMRTCSFEAVGERLENLLK